MPSDGPAIGITTSDPVRVTQVDTVESVLEEYHFDVEPRLEGETIVIEGDSYFRVYATTADGDRDITQGDQTTKFFESLAPYLRRSFEIQTARIRGSSTLDATKWLIKDGMVYRTNLSDLSERNMRFAIE